MPNAPKSAQATSLGSVRTPRGRAVLGRRAAMATTSSAVVHMAVLVGLGLLALKLDRHGELELEWAVTAAPVTQLETFSLVPDDHEETKPQAVSLSRTELQDVLNPELSLQLVDLPEATRSVDVAARLAGATKPSQAPASGEGGKFFGASAYGDDFVYVVDMSTSMGYQSHYGQTRFRIACRELLRSIHELQPHQRFCVVMFCYRTRVMFDRSPKLLAATAKNKAMLARWIANIRLASGTDPRYGVMTAMRMNPDAVFLLSDGEFNGRGVNMHNIAGDLAIEKLLQRWQGRVIPIHTIAFEDLLNRRRLRGIAGATGGSHRFVGNVSDQEIVLLDLRSRNLSDNRYAMQCLLAKTHRIRDDKHLKQAAGLLNRKLTGNRAELRAMAHRTLVMLAGDEDMGPSAEQPTIAEYREAQRKWKDYWEEHFDRERNEAEETAIKLGDGDDPELSAL